MLKGATGLKTIFSLVLGMMVLGTVGTAVTVGDLGDIIQQGLQDSSEFTDYTTEIDASDDGAEETFSDLAMFVRDRSVDCNRVDARNNGVPIGVASGQPYGNDGAEDDPTSPNAEGYPGLEETRLGLKPICTGGSSTIIRDKYDWVPTRGWLGGGPEDNVMPGILSREKFEITGDPESNKLYFEDRRPPTEDGETEHDLNHYWLENNLAGISDKAPGDHVLDSTYTYCSGGGDTTSCTGSVENTRNNYAYKGSGRNYIVFFETNVGANRTNRLLSEMEYSDRVWHKGDEASKNLWDGDNPDRYYAHELLLCPGDKGYIQINRGTPINTGMTDTDGAENYYPMIVVTDTEVVECDGESTLGGYDSYDGLAHGEQLYVHGGSDAWPEVDELHLAGRSEEDENRIKTHDQIDLEGDSETCEIYWQRNNWGSDGATLRTYDLGVKIKSDQSSFEFDHEDWEDASLASIALLNAMDLNGDTIDNPEATGELRPDNRNNGQNELYGDLICANPEDSDYAEWHICNEKLDESKRELEIYGDSWTCNPETGEWREEISAPEPAVVTNDWSSISPETGAWFEEEGDGFRIDSSETSDDVLVKWESPRLDDWNTIRVRVKPSETGHLQIGGLSDRSETRTYFNFDAYGEEKIWVQKYDDGETYEEAVSYDPSKTYTFVFSDFLSEVRILEEGTEVWSSSVDLGSLEFPVLRIYQGSGTNSWENIDATVEEVRITG